MLHYFLHPSAGLVLASILATVMTVAAIHTPKAEAQHQLAPQHCHVVDPDRSTIAVNANDTVTATCAVAGCHEVILLGHNVARAYMVVH